jgi:hypothetical protein
MLMLGFRAGVGRVAQVGLDDGGVHPQAAAAQDLALDRLLQEGAVEVLEDLEAKAASELGEGGGMSGRSRAMRQKRR